MRDDRDSGVRPEKGVQAEEAEEIERHEDLYRTQRPATLIMAADSWLRFDEDTPPAGSYAASVRRLGEVKGRAVLDYGCGDGWLSVILAKRGADRVIAFDISREAVRTGRARARANGVSRTCHFVVASAYALPFRSEVFDAVIGQAILHHLRHKDLVARGLEPVVRPGAKAVFAECLGNVLWLERLRLLVPVPSQAADDPDQWREQFSYRDVEAFRSRFDVSFQEFQLFSRLDRVVRAKSVIRFLNRLDRWLLLHVRSLRPFAREIVLELTAKSRPPVP